ncbi:amino acid transporter AVT3B-like [Patiria miniata]|uniref:Amino acid transporter transmembrane domain-containing protein n=1 Tax=Patiria miniata TaxID=46514 RepID=A0A914AHU3_PATMI|nr:amino acid transporter AVT3B-like [Patiria miniata]
MHDGGGATNPIKIFANIFISFVGAGGLGLPYAFRTAGILEGVLILGFVSIVSVKAMLMLIDCKYKLEERLDVRRKFKIVSKEKEDDVEGKELLKDVDGMSGEALTQNGGASGQQRKNSDDSAGAKNEIDYGDVGFYALGSKGKVIVDFSIVISQVGFSCAYLIFISSNLVTFVPGLSKHGWIALMMAPLTLLCLLRHLNRLAVFSLFADFANIFAYSVVFWFDFEHVQNVRIHPKQMSLVGFPFFLGIAFYCYEGAGMILALESSVLPTKRHMFRKIFIFALIIVTTLYISFGVCGYLSFGPSTESIITLNLPEGIVPELVKSCLCFSLFFTYPVMMFPVVITLERRLMHDKHKSTFYGNILRSGMVMVTGLVVILIPNIATLMALIGATCCTLLAFVLPGIFHMRIFKESLTRRQLAFDIFLIVMGIIAACFGTWDALKRLFPGLVPENLISLGTTSDAPMSTGDLQPILGLMNGTADI